MKKKVLRVVAGATLLVAMAVGVQMNSAQSESSLMMENLDAIAKASGESGGSYCRWDGYWCVLLGNGSVCPMGCDN